MQIFYRDSTENSSYARFYLCKKQTLNSDNHRSLGDGFFTRCGNIRFNNGQVGSGSEGEDEFALISFRNFTGNRK